MPQQLEVPHPAQNSTLITRRLSQSKGGHWGIIAVALLLIQKPINSHDLWWHLSRGREVLAGSFTPSKDLLLLDQSNEADWLSGVPFYTVWELGGVHALAGIPLLVAIVLSGMAWRHSSRKGGSWGSFLLLPLWLWTMRPGLQPVPQLFDLIGLIVLNQVLEGTFSVSLRRVLICFTFVGWANIGPCPLWGLLLLLLRPTDVNVLTPPVQHLPSNKMKSSRIQPTALMEKNFQLLLNLQFVLLAIVCGMFTPRGVLGWRDALVRFSPGLFQSLTESPLTNWQPAMSFQWGPTELAFLLLWVLWVKQSLIDLGRMPAHQQATKQQQSSYKIVMPRLQWVVILLTPLFAVILSHDNIPLSGIWMFLQWKRLGDHDTIASPVPVSWWTSRGYSVAGVVLLSLGLLDGTGLLLSSRQRLGWGIAQEIDPRLLTLPEIPDEQQSLIGWAPDGRSVGIVSWAHRNIQLVDHPQRALLGGRLKVHALVIQDLMGDHRARYRLEDGSWGGWVDTLRNWNVECLFIPVEMQTLTASFTKSTWRAFDLDSPTIPYAQVESFALSGGILETLQQQSFVELGPWQPGLEIYDGQGWRFDPLTYVGFGPQPAGAIRQSQIFRSMDIPTASLRALLPVRQRSANPDLWSEFQECQSALVIQEWTTFGRASEFRQRVLNTIRPQNPATVQQPWFDSIPETETIPPETWERLVREYLQGNLDAAIENLPLESAQLRYAAAMMWLELGATDRTIETLEPLLNEQTETGMRIAAEYWLGQMKQFTQRLNGMN